MHPTYLKGLPLEALLCTLAHGDDNDQALGACLHAAVGSWLDQRAENHLKAVRLAVNGQVVLKPALEPSLN